MRVLVTRPEADARRTAERLKLLKHEALIDSVLVIESVPFDTGKERFDAVAITSANAMRAVGSKALAPFFLLPVFVVGAHSGDAAREAGFRQVVVCDGDALALAKTLSDRLSAGARVLYLAGEDRAHDLAALVKAAGIEVETKIVYRAVPTARLQETTINLIRKGEIVAILHYSARSAGVFLDLIRKENLADAASKIRHLCLSDAVASPPRQAGFDVKIAARPDEDALFALLG